MQSSMLLIDNMNLTYTVNPNPYVAVLLGVYAF